jgi:hypothetical protein
VLCNVQSLCTTTYPIVKLGYFVELSLRPDLLLQLSLSIRYGSCSSLAQPTGLFQQVAKRGHGAFLLLEEHLLCFFDY